MRSIIYSLLALVLFNTNQLLAQKKNKEKELIHLSEGLSLNSIPIKVKFGATITKPNMSAGLYRIIDATDKWPKNKYKSNFWGTKSSMNVQDDFSFIVENSRGESCLIEYLLTVSKEEKSSFPIGEFYFGKDQVLAYEAAISILVYSTEDEDPWLYIDSTTLNERREYVRKRGISSKDKTLRIEETDSNLAGGKQREFPAYGWEVFDENTGIAAIQFTGPGVMGANQYQIWLKDGLEEEAKLKLTGIFMAIIHHSLKNMIY
jgi:hypothetical protein